MFRIILIIVLGVSLVGCATNHQSDPPPEKDDQDNTMDEAPTNDEMLVESREEFGHENERISTAEAEDLVRNYLNIESDSNTVIAYQSKLEDGRYLVEVNTVDDQKNHESGDNIDGTYVVNPVTKDVQTYTKQ